MPEGPEIRIEADAIAKALVAQPLEHVSFAFAQLKHYEEPLRQSRVVNVRAHGKAMLIAFANKLTIYSHNQLYGRWLVRKAGSMPRTNRTLRLALHAPRRWALLYSASEIEVLGDAGLLAHSYLRKLGPDILNEQANEVRVAEQLTSKACRRRRLSALYLDQSCIAGIGNYLRSEILHAAMLSPDRRPMDCSDDEIAALANATCLLVLQSYKTKGITNDLERVAQLKESGVSRARYRFAVFGRAQAPCYVCGTPILKVVRNARRLYQCARCQR